MNINKHVLIYGGRKSEQSIVRTFIVAIARLNSIATTVQIGKELYRDHSTITTHWKKIKTTPWIQQEFYKFFPEEANKMKRVIHDYNIKQAKSRKL